jgi:hypothetical protein
MLNQWWNYFHSIIYAIMFQEWFSKYAVNSLIPYSIVYLCEIWIFLYQKVRFQCITYCRNSGLQDYSCCVENVWLENQKYLFWNISLYDLLKVNKPFSRTYHRAEQETCIKVNGSFHTGFLLGVFFNHEWRWYVFQKYCLNFYGLHSAIYRKTVLFINTAVRTSYHTKIFLYLII